MNKQTDTRFALVGNKPALDFANTVHARRKNADALQSASDLFDLLDHLALLSGDTLTRYRALAIADAEAGRDLFTLAITLRHDIRQWLETAPHSPAPDHPLVVSVNHILALGASRDTLVHDGAGWTLAPAPLAESPLLALVPIARSMAALIAEGPDAPIRKCGNPRCPLYFYDTSRNQKRRWCSMESCGNQAKVRAHLDRQAHIHAAE